MEKIETVIIRFYHGCQRFVIGIISGLFFHSERKDKCRLKIFALKNIYGEGKPEIVCLSKSLLL